VLTADEQDGSWAWFDAQGSLVGRMDIPPGISAYPSSVHIAGRLSGSMLFPMLIVYTWQPQPAIIHFSRGRVSVLRSTDGFIALSGAPAQPLIAFSEISYQDESGKAKLYAAYGDDLHQAAPLTYTPAELPGFVPVPLAVEAVRGAVGSVWYTLSGRDARSADMFFPLTIGLFRLNLSSGQVEQLLGRERNVQGLSTGRSLAASVPVALGEDKPLQVHHLASSRVMQFDLQSEQTAAGFAVFSPHNQHIAWLEVGATANPESSHVDAVVRTGQITSGKILGEVDLPAAARAAELDHAAWMRPVGWLDENQLLIEVSGADWQPSELVRLDVYSGSLFHLCPGRFLAFIYP